jgi:predicted dehydrogenase
VKPLRVGVVGTGPWAVHVRGATLARHPETTLVGVWGRRPDATAEAAAALGVEPLGTFDELLAAVDAVALAVAPLAQPKLAVAAARVAKPLLLEKPLAVCVAGAAAIETAVREHGVGTLVALTYRFAREVDELVEAARLSPPTAARITIVSDANLRGPFARGWRLEKALLLDVAPHVFDLLLTLLGPIGSLRARGDADDLVQLVTYHDAGATGQALLCQRAEVAEPMVSVETIARGRYRRVDLAAIDFPAAQERLVADFVDVARDRAQHAIDATHGVLLQRLVEAASVSLHESREVADYWSSSGPERRGT